MGVKLLFLRLDVQSSRGYRGGREIRKRRRSSSSDQYWGITSSLSLSLCLFYLSVSCLFSLHLFISISLNPLFLKLFTATDLFVFFLPPSLPSVRPLTFAPTVSMRISQISYRQSLSRESTLLTLEEREGEKKEGGVGC